MLSFIKSIFKKKKERWSKLEISYEVSPDTPLVIRTYRRKYHSDLESGETVWIDFIKWFNGEDTHILYLLDYISYNPLYKHEIKDYTITDYYK